MYPSKAKGSFERFVRAEARELLRRDELTMGTLKHRLYKRDFPRRLINKQIILPVLLANKKLAERIKRRLMNTPEYRRFFMATPPRIQLETAQALLERNPRISKAELARQLQATKAEVEDYLEELQHKQLKREMRGTPPLSEANLRPMIEEAKGLLTSGKYTGDVEVENLLLKRHRKLQPLTAYKLVQLARVGIGEMKKAGKLG